MLQTIQNKSVQLLETVVQKLEQYEPLQKRPRVYAKASQGGSDEAVSPRSSSSVNSDDDAHVDSKEKLKQLSFELIDIGLHTKNLGLELVQSSAPYQQLHERIQGLEEQVKDGSL